MIHRLTSFYSIMLDFTKFGQLTLSPLPPLDGYFRPPIWTKVLTFTTFNLVHLSGGCAQFKLAEMAAVVSIISYLCVNLVYKDLKDFSG